MSLSDQQPPKITRQRLFLIAFVAVALLLALGSILGGLSNYQRLYEAGHQDPFGQTIDDAYGAQSGETSARQPAE